MKCAWKELLSILPPRLRDEMDKSGGQIPEEIRLRVNHPIELIVNGKSRILTMNGTFQDIQFVVNTASRYSPWAASSVSQGYITAPGGHRIGICGECVIHDGLVTGIRTVNSLCIRVAKAYPGIGQNAPASGSILILGPPGVGKTTLLRDMIRIRSQMGSTTAVVDEREEIFPPGNIFETGPRTDVLTGCSKAQGVAMALRTMSPKCIAVDEITDPEDCTALIRAGWCGVELLATAHAASIRDLQMRPVYKPLAQCGLFQQFIVLNRDKSWRLERMELCT